MRKINIFVPVIGLAFVLIAVQAPTIAEYVSDSKQLDSRMAKCVEKVKNPENNARCINASAAANHQWQGDMNSAVSVLNQRNAAVKLLIENCATSKCYSGIKHTPEGKALETAKQSLQTLKAAKPPVWTAS